MFEASDPLVQVIQIQRTEYSLTVEYDGYIVRHEP